MPQGKPSKRPPTKLEKLLGKEWQRPVTLVTMLATVHVVLLSVFFVEPGGVAAAGNNALIGYILSPLLIMHEIQDAVDLVLPMDDFYFMVVTISGLITIFIVYSIYIAFIMGVLFMKNSTAKAVGK